MVFEFIYLLSYETTIICDKQKVNGYGRNDLEATANSILNIFEYLLEDEMNIGFLRYTLKKSIQIKSN